MNEDRYQKSRELLERARQSLAGGVSSPFRAQFPVPLYFEDGCGARLTDVDGNRYVDYTLAWGPNILGYRHPRMVETMTRAAAGVHTYGAQHRLEPEVAEKFCKMVPCAERVAFTSSGTEAVQAALRLARGFTRRNLILKFESHYHGWVDSVLLSYRGEGLNSRGQVANALDNVIIAPWNSREAVERIFAERGSEIAAVITEPVLCNSGCILPLPGFHEFLRAITQEHGALLIFDEVITGFRMGPGGAQEHYRIMPDLATFGKALAAGLPMSAVAGRREILEEMYKGVVFGGTFNGNPMVLAAANTALDLLADGTLLAEANRLGREFMHGVARIAAAKGVELLVHGFGAAFGVHFAEGKERLTKYVRAMLDEGIYLLPDGRAYTSCAHTGQDIAETLAAVERVLS
jgi:glutamate-1-semialdehyde 2,1-aminomutase